MKYNKLVRDKIPEIIKSKGENLITHVADEAEYARLLREKLEEEVREYLENEGAEEMADIVEVLEALQELRGISAEELASTRKEKAETRGRFKDRIVLDEA
jgi:predicted house-cleaning noncanonical NTP pyrophosphatase (MazG superfamily)